ncbi:ribosome modulation factor domain superfamily protein [Agrobacterium phage OLIVR4]|nr:ribosome modulation factor domain superfamily protein [Agrobacterium phage OLIVR4]
MDYATARGIVDSWFWDTSIDPRRMKRAERVVMEKGNLFLAYNRGMLAFYQGRAKTDNPFPPGARRDQWEQGFNYGVAT